MNLVFKKLASLTIWHDYFLPEGTIRHSQIPEDYSIEEYLEILPTKETAKKLRDLQIRLKKTPTGIEFYAESEKIGNSFFPKIVTTENINLSFDVIVKSTSIYNSSVLNAVQNKMYAVSNFNIQDLTVDDGNGGTENILYLNKSIDTHLNATIYNIEEFVEKSGNTFVSLQGNNDKATSNTSFWKNLGTTSFISKNDAYDFERNVLLTPSTTSVKGKALIIKNNINDEVVNVPIENSLNDIAAIDISNFENGLYHLFIDNIFHSSFVKNSPERQSIATIEIAIQGNPTNLYSGITALTKEQMLVGNGQDGTQNGEILENHWVVRILNRSTHWKYIFNKEQTFNNTDLATAGFEKLSTTEIQSLLPKALAAKGVEVDPGLGFLLPNPSRDSTKILYDLNKNVEKYVSELYINI